LLAPIADKPNAHPRLLAMACFIASQDGVVVLDGKARCERALQAAPDAVEPALGAVRFAVRTGDVDAEERAFIEVGARLTRSTGDPQAMAMVADVAAWRGRYTLAEDAIAEASSSTAALERMRSEVAVQRSQRGIKRGAVAAKDEPALAAAVLALERADDVGAARKSVDEALARFGDVAGLYAAKCGLLWRVHARAEADKACARALALDDGASVAHIYTGILAEERGNHDRAQAEVERALVLDPETHRTWILMRDILLRANDKHGLAALNARYHDRFGADLH
jgi:hypothetical protein